MKAVKEIGLRRALRFAWISVLLEILRCLFLPPLRSAFLRICGTRVGRDTVLQRFVLINVDRGGFGALSIADDCFVGDEVLIDLAAPVILEEQVTLAARVLVLTHLNVGYRDHPLQARFPATAAPVLVRRGSFLGAGVTVLPGRTIGPGSFVAAGSVVTEDVPPWTLVAGAPARPRRSLRPIASLGG